MVDETVNRRYVNVATGIENGELRIENEADAQGTGTPEAIVNSQFSILNSLQAVLQLEAVACKDWLTNKVDRSVTGKVARQQCQGELQLPLSDCGVVALDYRGRAGIATALGHAPQAGLADPAAGSVLSVAEALTNIVWAPLTDGLDGVSLSANWMWPCRSQKGEDARLYRAVEALSDFCCALGINVPTGKDSLSMTQKYPDGTKVIAPGTVIVSSGGEVSDVRKVVSPVLNVAEQRSSLYHIDFSFDELRLGGSAYAQAHGRVGSDVPTCTNPEYFRDAFEAVQECVRRGWLLAGHDISAGGLITTLLEMCFANTRGGMKVNLNRFVTDDLTRILFAENPGVVVQVAERHEADFKKLMDDAGVGYIYIGVPCRERTMRLRKGDMEETLDIDALRDVWYAPSHRLDTKQSFNGCADLRAANYKHQPLQWNIAYPLPLTVANVVGRVPAERKVRAAIIREKGTNGEREMAYSLYLAGFDVKDVMMTDLISGRETLDDIQMIVFCGGFSNSDVLGSAKGWAGAFLFNPKAKAALDRFYARPDTLSLGICNGCQLMVELQLIENGELRIENGELRMENEAGAQGAGMPEAILNSQFSILNSHPKAVMEHNTSHKFESAFLGLTIPKNDSVMLGSMAGQKLGIWVAHGEGRFSLPRPEGDYHVVAKYSYHDYPANPNGSDYDVAGLCSADGRHLAMMPHLERAIFPWQCAYYPTARTKDEVTPWLQAFVNARRWCEAHTA